MEEGLKIAVCDDEQEVLGLLAHEIRKTFRALAPGTTVTEFQDEKQLFAELTAGKLYDVIFLDIDMPKANGIDLAVDLRKAGTKSLIIFVSNLEGHVYRSFAAKPFRFIRKSEFRKELPEAAEAVLKEFAGENVGILLKNGNNLIRLNPYRIVYAESKGKLLEIHYENRSIELTCQISALEKELEGYGFIRIHKGYLVNYRFIFRINKEDLTLDSGVLLPVSRLRMQEVKSQYRRWTI